MAWRWAWILGLALIAPAALPAGGGDRRSPEVRRRQAREPLLLHGGSCLQCAPHRAAPVLAHLPSGEPLRLLRTWWDPAGRRWLQVQAQTAVVSARRGWLPG
jgi:hypothetical protein